jgi:hypothetical protein
MAELIRKAHDTANAKGLCEEFDDFMEEIGLPPRSKDWEVTVKLTDVYLTIEVNATSEDDALEAVDNQMVAEQLRKYVRDSQLIDGEWEAREAYES